MSATHEFINQLGTLSYVGIFGVSIIANVVIPVPEEVILLALGYLAGTGRVNGIILLPIVILGLLVSDVTMYWLSKKGNRLITFFYNKFFAKRLDEKRAWLETHIEKVIFFSRFMVQLRFIGPFLAGQAKVSWRKFLTFELAALVIYVPLYIWAGWYFRERVEFIISGVAEVRNIVLIIAGLVILFSLSKLVYRYAFDRPAK